MKQFSYTLSVLHFRSLSTLSLLVLLLLLSPPPLLLQAASSVGLAATQLVKALWSNVTVITTASSSEKLTISKQNGADVCINYKTHNFADEVLRATNNRGR